MLFIVRKERVNFRDFIKDCKRKPIESSSPHDNVIYLPGRNMYDKANRDNNGDNDNNSSCISQNTNNEKKSLCKPVQAQKHASSEMKTMNFKDSIMAPRKGDTINNSDIEIYIPNGKDANLESNKYTLHELANPYVNHQVPSVLIDKKRQQNSAHQLYVSYKKCYLTRKKIALKMSMQI